MEYSIAYDKATEIYRNDLNLLFRRLNFFLIGVAFLITGLAALVASRYYLHYPIIAFAYIICTAGFYLSLCFTFINYLNTRNLYKFGEYIHFLEKKYDEQGEVKREPAIMMKTIVQSTLRGAPWRLFKRLGSKLCGLIANPSREPRRSTANNAYLISIGFVVFWVLIFFVSPAPIPIHALTWF